MRAGNRDQGTGNDRGMFACKRIDTTFGEAGRLAQMTEEKFRSTLAELSVCGLIVERMGDGKPQWFYDLIVPGPGIGSRKPKETLNLR